MSDRISWSNPRVLAVLLLVFLAGGLSGAIALRLVRGRALAPRGLAAGGVPASNGISAWANKEGFLGRCKKELDLRPDQADKISAVLDDYRMYYQNLQEQLEEVRVTGKGRIVEILDEGQRKKFEKLLAAEPR